MIYDASSFDNIQRHLGDPFCSGEDYAIYCSDCISSLLNLPEELCSLTVTSPPYNIGKEYENPLPLEEYLNWCEQWIKEVYRITCPNGAFWLMSVTWKFLERRKHCRCRISCGINARFI
jgi:adenine-specific DNA-methyltransferase